MATIPYLYAMATPTKVRIVSKLGALLSPLVVSCLLGTLLLTSAGCGSVVVDNDSQGGAGGCVNGVDGYTCPCKFGHGGQDCSVALCVVAIARGDWHTLALKSDGTVWAWGDNHYGQLGDGTTLDKSIPVQVPNLSGVVDIAAASSYSLALRSDGTVWAWGDNIYGVLGDGSGSHQSKPVQVMNLSGIVALAASGKHNLALKSDGTVWGWGDNYHGQLGNGETTGNDVPVQVMDLSSVVAVSASNSSSLALKGDGTVWAWGVNDSGQLGNGTIGKSEPTPMQVLNLSSVIAISAGGPSSLAVKADGTVWAWGVNADPTPVQVLNLSNVVAVAAGSSSMALKGDGTVWAWGNNWQGELGDGTTTSKDTPVQVADLSDIVVIAAKGGRAIKSDSTVWAWGVNNHDQLGDGTGSTMEPTPVQVTALTGAAAISAGSQHSLAVTSEGSVWAWGYNEFGALGDGTTKDQKSPVQVANLSNIKTVATGANFVSPFWAANKQPSHSLALRADGTVWAWGHNDYGQLGDGTTIDKTTPLQVANLSNVVAIAASGSHSLALEENGTVWAWGDNNSGQLGDGTASSPKPMPVQVVKLSGVVAIAAGRGYYLNDISGQSMALKGDGTVWAWGGNYLGQLGDGTTTSKNMPVQVANVSNVVAVAAGASHMLALEGDGTVWAWGRNDSGQLGDGSLANKSTPVQVANLSGVVAIAAGWSFSLALTSDGTVWAWGDNDYGQLGKGSSDGPELTPSQVLKLWDVVAIAAGTTHALAMKGDGTIWAWGLNYNGQLGNGKAGISTTPVQALLTCP